MSDQWQCASLEWQSGWSSQCQTTLRWLATLGADRDAQSFTWPGSSRNTCDLIPPAAAGPRPVAVCAASAPLLRVPIWPAPSCREHLLRVTVSGTGSLEILPSVPMPVLTDESGTHQLVPPKREHRHPCRNLHRGLSCSKPRTNPRHLPRGEPPRNW